MRRLEDCCFPHPCLNKSLINSRKKPLNMLNKIKAIEPAACRKSHPVQVSGQADPCALARNANILESLTSIFAKIFFLFKSTLSIEIESFSFICSARLSPHRMRTKCSAKISYCLEQLYRYSVSVTSESHGP